MLAVKQSTKQQFGARIGVFLLLWSGLCALQSGHWTVPDISSSGMHWISMLGCSAHKTSKIFESQLSHRNRQKLNCWIMRRNCIPGPPMRVWRKGTTQHSITTKDNRDWGDKIFYFSNCHLICKTFKKASALPGNLQWHYWCPGPPVGQPKHTDKMQALKPVALLFFVLCGSTAQAAWLRLAMLRLPYVPPSAVYVRERNDNWTQRKGQGVQGPGSTPVSWCSANGAIIDFACYSMTTTLSYRLLVLAVWRPLCSVVKASCARAFRVPGVQHSWSDEGFNFGASHVSYKEFEKE